MSAEATPPESVDRRPAKLSPLQQRIRSLLLQVPGGEQRFWALVLACGATSGLGAVGLLELLTMTQRLVWGPGQFLDAVRATTPLYRVVVLVAAGGLVALASWLLKRPVGGHGTAGILEAIWVQKGRYSLTRAVTNGVLAVVVVAMGAPLGREGALLAFGAGMGSLFARSARLSANQARTLVACGAASGLAAAYNVPIGAALFGLEVLLGTFALELLGPIVVACVVGTVVSRILAQAQPAYVIPYYEVETRYVFMYALIGLALGVASALYIRVVESWSEFAERVRWPMAAPIVALLITGGLATVFPELTGNGYEAVDVALRGAMPLNLLLVLPLLKLLASAIASGAGVPGGLFTPSLFYGALVGGALGHAVEYLFGFGAPIGSYALVGMTAVLAATTHAVASSVLIIFEMTNEYGLILPLMFSSVAASVVCRALETDSLYTGVLRRRNVPLPDQPVPSWMRDQPLAPYVEPALGTVSPGTRFEEMLVTLVALPPGHDLYVVDAEGRYRGTIALDLLKGHLPDRAHLEFLVAADVADSTLPTVPPDVTVSDALRAAAETVLDRLAVVDAERRFHGTVSSSRLLGVRD